MPRSYVRRHERTVCSLLLILCVAIRVTQILIYIRGEQRGLFGSEFRLFGHFAHPFGPFRV